MEETALTTVDNPYNPFTQFDIWNEFDMRNGYDTCSKLGRLAKTSIGLSDADNEQQIDDAMNRIIEMHPTLYIKVTPDSFEERMISAIKD